MDGEREGERVSGRAGDLGKGREGGCVGERQNKVWSRASGES